MVAFFVDVFIAFLNLGADTSLTQGVLILLAYFVCHFKLVWRVNEGACCNSVTAISISAWLRKIATFTLLHALAAKFAGLLFFTSKHVLFLFNVRSLFNVLKSTHSLLQSLAGRSKFTLSLAWIKVLIIMFPMEMHRRRRLWHIWVLEGTAFVNLQTGSPVMTILTSSMPIHRVIFLYLLIPSQILW